MRQLWQTGISRPIGRRTSRAAILAFGGFFGRRVDVRKSAFPPCLSLGGCRRRRKVRGRCRAMKRRMAESCLCRGTDFRCHSDT
jgi:hypothetical protein